MRGIVAYRHVARSLALLLVLGSLMAACNSGSERSDDAGGQTPADEAGPRGMVLGEPVPAPDFELIDQHGNPFRLSDHSGRVTAMFFGYTFCPDICPLTLMHMGNAIDHLEEQADNALFLWVTVDPERDTPEQLSRYINRANPGVVGLTGEPESLAQVWEDYSIRVEKFPRDDGSYLLGHSSQIWLIDRQGRLAMVLPASADGKDLANDMRWLLEQS